jgi:hypothetical protein
MISELYAIRAANQQMTDQAAALAANARAQAEAEYSALTMRQMEESQDTAWEISRRIRQGMRERGTLRVAQGESGLSGVSMSRDEIASFVWQNEDIGSLKGSEANKMAQIQRQKMSVQAGAQGEVNKANALLKGRTTGLPAALRLISAGVSGWSTGKAIYAPFENNEIKKGPFAGARASARGGR